MEFSLPISIAKQVFRKRMPVRRFFLSLAAGSMLAACVAGCQTAPPQAQADTAPIAAGVRNNPPSLAAAAGQPSPSLDPKMPPAAQAALQEREKLAFPVFPGTCTFFPQHPECNQLLPGEREVTSFGSNPGNLKMFQYVPQDLGTSPPLVVALHGCGQSATSYDDETGWVQLANKFHFVLLLPQQDQNNNFFKCFKWFDSNHNQRDKGEAFSIKHMIDTMLADTSLNIDRKRVYVTGLSAGGGMTVVMLATYPEIFAGGAPVAGIPYGCAPDLGPPTSACGLSLGGMPGTPSNTTMTQLSPAEWGDRVRKASPSPAGPFPRVSIWQGTKDHVVNPQDEIELIKQWTNVLGVSQTPQVDVAFKTTRHQVFQDSAGKPMVEAFIVKDMDHGTPIDPGPAADQCGTSVHDQFIISAGICSSFYIAKFWGLVPSP